MLPYCQARLGARKSVRRRHSRRVWIRETTRKHLGHTQRATANSPRMPPRTADGQDGHRAAAAAAAGLCRGSAEPAARASQGSPGLGERGSSPACRRLEGWPIRCFADGFSSATVTVGAQLCCARLRKKKREKPPPCTIAATLRPWRPLRRCGRGMLATSVSMAS